MARLLAFLLLALSAVAAAAAPIDQAAWNGRKQQVTLPNGIRLSYVELGDPAGPPLLLLHGWTDSSRSWTPIAPYLLKHRLLILDQRGHGGSDKPDCCYALSSFAHDARLFLDAKGIARTAIAGHSLGSMVAQNLAADHPERVSKLILIGSTALAPATRGDYLWKNVSAMTSVDPNSSFLREWNPANGAIPVDPEFAAAAMDEIVATPLHVWRGVLRELTGVPVGRLDADIRAPTLILSGGSDLLFAPEHHQSLVRAIPHARAHVYPELGHNLLWERPKEIAAADDPIPECAGKARAMTIDDPQSRRARSARVGSFQVALPPERAFDLFTAEGERAWAPGWDPIILSGGPDALQPGSVFLTDHGGEDTIWTVVEADRACGRLTYSRVSPPVRAGTVRVTIRAEEGGSRVEVAYDMTSLGPAGDAVVADMNPERFAQMMREWERLIVAALAADAQALPR